ncbi:MAG: class I SAM-dependent methyltransferase [Pseudorhodobacter sp.]
MGANVLSPLYLQPGFYGDALAKGRHRAIIGGRWDETGIIQMNLLQREGLRPKHRLLDIGCGPLRTGCRLVHFLNPQHYWGTDLSRDLMLRGYREELTESGRARLPREQLVKDGDFAFPGVPDIFDYLFCFALFTHFPLDFLERGLAGITRHFRCFDKLLFTIFLAPEDGFSRPCRQNDGVVTHPDRPPWHFREADIHDAAAMAGLKVMRRDIRLPRGQVLFGAQGPGRQGNLPGP